MYPYTLGIEGYQWMHAQGLSLHISLNLLTFRGLHTRYYSLPFQTGGQVASYTLSCIPVAFRR